ncbi:signal peptide peptidase SppA [Camelimonas abortus]|uniref:Signal peptide peptidase SppA n=1 Tax=Camelimonas abortus TaxID=1017184 RepID=A0ABV7LEQ1_9HYPH
MFSDAELLVDRRLLRRRLAAWRALAVVAVLGAVVFAGVVASREGVAGGEHVARVNVTGVITGSRATLDMLRRVGETPSARAVIVAIDSPGGGVTGSADIYAALRELSKKKPTVAVINSLGASGAYMVALGADRILARDTSLVGSIGVIMQFPNFSVLLDRVGVKVDEIKSSPLKASPNPFAPTPPAANEAMAAVVADSYAWFRDLVRTRRGIEGEALAKVSDGRVFTGRQALALRLIDQTGDERDALRWLEKEKGIAAGLKIREWKPQRAGGFSLASLGAQAARLSGLETLARTLEQAAQPADPAGGLLAVWTGPQSP